MFRKQKITKGAGSIELNRAITLNELVSSPAIVTLVEKRPDEWRSFPIADQDGSGSCVAQTVAKMAGIHYWLENGEYVPFSATHIYQRRANKPMTGMGFPDLVNIAKQGITLEALVPSQLMSDDKMDSIEIPEYKKKVGEIFKLGDGIVLPAGDFDTIASTVLTTKKPVMAWFYFTYDEWTDKPEVKNYALDKFAEATCRHSVTIVDACKVNGEDALIIEDSWGLGRAIKGRRIITRVFFNERNYFALYFRKFIYVESLDKPKYKFKESMKFGDRGEDIKALQEVLRYNGMFPQDQETTGYYGQLTADGVYQFQLKYDVDTILALSQLEGRVVGPKTIAKLNKYYG